MGHEVKNPLRAQSKYGLMGSNAKTGKGHRNEKDVIFWIQNIKVPFGIGHPQLHITSSLYVCRRVQGSQILKQN